MLPPSASTPWRPPRGPAPEPARGNGDVKDPAPAGKPPRVVRVRLWLVRLIEQLYNFLLRQA